MPLLSAESYQLTRQNRPLCTREYYLYSSLILSAGSVRGRKRVERGENWRKCQKTVSSLLLFLLFVRIIIYSSTVFVSLNFSQRRKLSKIPQTITRVPNSQIFSRLRLNDVLEHLFQAAFNSESLQCALRPIPCWLQRYINYYRLLTWLLKMLISHRGTLRLWPLPQELSIRFYLL